jgi:hypothetical protein
MGKATPKRTVSVLKRKREQTSEIVWFKTMFLLVVVAWPALDLFSSSATDSCTMFVARIKLVSIHLFEYNTRSVEILD